MKMSEVIQDRTTVMALWSRVEKERSRVKTPIAKEEYKKIEDAVIALFQKLDMESINPDLQD